MAQAKKTNNKSKNAVEEVPPIKIAKELDLDVGENVIPDKIIDDAELPEETEESDEPAEGAELDEEEINPFKDKWEE